MSSPYWLLIEFDLRSPCDWACRLAEIAKSPRNKGTTGWLFLLTLLLRIYEYNLVFFPLHISRAPVYFG